MNSDVLKILQEKKELQPDPEYMPNPYVSFFFLSEAASQDMQSSNFH